MNTQRSSRRFVFCATFLLFVAVPIVRQASAQTKIVLLGTGVPAPTPDRSGPATAIVVGERAYRVDFGPGVVRRAAAAAEKTPAVGATRITVAFVTHLHSDHTAGLPDVILTPWVKPCDVLIHEVYSPSTTVPSMPDWKAYRAHYHTSTEELGQIASRTKPGLLIIYHVSGRGTGPGGRTPDEQLLEEVHKNYAGKVVIGHDLEIY